MDPVQLPIAGKCAEELESNNKILSSCAKDREANGFFITWTDNDTLQLTCLLIYLLFLYKRFHQCFEDDNILIFDIGKKKNTLKQDLMS